MIDIEAIRVLRKETDAMCRDAAKKLIDEINERFAILEELGFKIVNDGDEGYTISGFELCEHTIYYTEQYIER